MTTRFGLAVVCVLISASAIADTALKCVDQPNLACAKTAGAVGVVPQTCGAGLFFNQVTANGVLNCATPSGSSSPNLVGVHSCMPITSGQSGLFMTASSCLDPLETGAQEAVKNSVTLGALQCGASGTPSGGAVTIQGRQGACGGSLADVSGFACSITSSGPTCTGGANTMAVNAGNCWSLKVSTTGIVSAVSVGCTMERAA